MKMFFEPFDFERGDAFRMSGAIVRTVKPDGRVNSPGVVYGEPWLIGSITTMQGKDKRWVMISTMDGIVNGPYTAEELCGVLNDGGYERMFRPVRIYEELGHKP